MIEGKLVALELHNGFGGYRRARTFRINSGSMAALGLDQGIGEDSGDRGRWTAVQPGSSITKEQSAACGLGCEGRGPDEDHQKRRSSMVLSVPGMDYESLDRSQQEYAVKRLEAALKAFGPGFHVYQYLFKSNRPA